MNKEQGSSIIGLIAVAAVAILVGIWIGAKTDIAEMDMDVDIVTPVMHKVMKQEVAENTTAQTIDETNQEVKTVES